MKIKLFNYSQLDTFVHRLSGFTKLVCFIFLTSSVMLTADIRLIMFILVLSLILLKIAKINYEKIRLMLIYVFIFVITNQILTFIFAPQYGVEIYGTCHEIFSFGGRYIVTLEQLFYQLTKFVKYIAVIPLGFIFFLTTDPSEFASSLNNIGIGYKTCTVLSLSLRYFPDIQRDYMNISLAQQARGIDTSHKAKLKDRIKNVMKVILPLIFSTLDRVELITNAMDLRGYGKHKKRTWYSFRPLVRNDYFAIIFSALVFIFAMYLRFFILGSMFYNPFI